MPRSASPLVFCVVLLGLCLLTMGPWRWLQKGYSHAFCGGVNLLLQAGGGNAGLLGTAGAARFFSEYDSNSSHDVIVGVFNTKRQGKDGLGRQRISSRHTGYMPAATLLALVLASPVPLRRKLWALAWGELTVHAFVALRVVFVILESFQGTQPHDLFLLASPWDGAFRLLFHVVAGVPATTYLVPLVVWIAVTFDRRDLIRLFPALAGPPDRT